MDNMEVSNDRVAVYEALKNLIVSGNVLLKLTEQGLRVYRLENYVVKRDNQGNVLKIIIKEVVNLDTLPEQTRNAIIEGKAKEEYENKELDLNSYRLDTSIRCAEELIGKNSDIPCIAESIMTSIIF